MIPVLVTGTVLSVSVELPGDRLPRTHVELEQDDGVVLQVVLPGANGGFPVAVGGVPTVTPGETWQVELVDAPAGLVPLGLGAGMSRLDGPPPPPWALNGVHYSEEQLPLVFVLNEAGSADLGFSLTEQIVQQTLASWTEVGCSSFAFEYGGTTDAFYDDDGVNVLSWEDGETWEWGATNIAGLTATRFEATDDGGIRPVGADIVFNGVQWEWLDGDGSPYEHSLDATSVVLHELGHVTGLDHELHWVTSTMFFAYQGGAWMGSLAGDDRRGLCENYPTGGDECSDDGDCAGIDDQDRICVDIDGIKVCDEVRDDVGDICSPSTFNCPEYCVFDLVLDQEGYCSVGCESHGDCPEGYLCDRANNFMYDQVTVDELLCVQGQRPEDTGADDTGAGGADSGGADEPGGCGCASAGPSIPRLLLPLLALSAIVRRTGGSA